MTLTERVHNGCVRDRRVNVLASQIAELIPPQADVLDVGCGDGGIARRIQELRSDISVSGIDVLVRPDAKIPVSHFDGATIPAADAAIDIVLLVDVLHHTNDPMILLREAARAARHGIIIKDHLLEGFLAGPVLRFMDRVGNRRHNVVLPHNYWRHHQWQTAWAELGLRSETWRTRLGLYPPPANLIFERSLHFLALLRPIHHPTYERTLRTDKQLA